jgi:hypothetical protein
MDNVKSLRPDPKEILQKIIDSKDDIKNIVVISETYRGLPQVSFSDMRLADLSFYSEVLKLELYKKMTNEK